MQNKPNFSGSYASLNTYIAPLRPELWRLFVGIALMLAIYLAGIVIIFVFADLVLGLDLDAFSKGAGPIEMVMLLFSFVFMALAVMGAAIWPARRSVLGLIGPIGAAWRDFWAVFAASIVVVALAFGMTWAFDPSFAPNLSVGQMLIWLPIAVIVLFIQISAEELVFRGYIMGQLAARFSHPALWMVLPSVLFGAVHYDADSYGNAAWVVCAVIVLFALTASDLTARRGNLGAAMALHFVSNIMVLILIGEKGKLDGLALNTADLDPSNPVQVMANVLFIVILWLAARLALRV